MTESYLSKNLPPNFNYLEVTPHPDVRNQYVLLLRSFKSSTLDLRVYLDSEGIDELISELQLLKQC